jgi:hypothetical protein
MGCLTTAKRAEIQAQIDKLDILIAAYDATLLAAATGGEIEEYRFDSGDGSQKAIRRDPNSLNKLLETLQSRRNRLQGELDGTGIVSMKLRRKAGHGRIY